MRAKIAAARLLRRVPTPRQAHAAAVTEHFGHLDPKVVDQFFENFGFTMPLSLLDKLQSICRRRRPELVVEFGAGVSTTVLEAEVNAYGGVLVSVEADPRWLADAHARLPQRGGAVLVSAPAASDSPDVLDYAALGELLGGRAVGLVVIDGPAHADRFSSGAMELYRHLGARQAVFAIDDTDRAHDDSRAHALAEDLGLDKQDFDDPMFPSHRYSILEPATAP